MCFFLKVVRTFLMSGVCPDPFTAPPPTDPPPPSPPITISNPINAGIGMETLSVGRRSARAAHDQLNFPFGTSGQITSQHSTAQHNRHRCTFQEKRTNHRNPADHYDQVGRSRQSRCRLRGRSYMKPDGIDLRRQIAAFRGEASALLNSPGGGVFSAWPHPRCSGYLRG